MREEALEKICKNRLVAIARGLDVEDMVPTARALYSGGVRCLEITFDQSSDTCLLDTPKAIALIKQEFGADVCVGAGTVMSVEQAEAAAGAGADFALAPNMDPVVIARAVQLDMAAVPGAMTPTEIAAAYAAGADIVKLFPASLLGSGYLRAIKGPLGHIPLMAVGGVNLDNIEEFLNAGFCSAGVGSELVRPSLVKAKKFDELTRLAHSYTERAGSV